MPRRDRTYRLTAEIEAANAGFPVVCLPLDAIGRTYRLHASRPGPASNRAVAVDYNEGGTLLTSEATAALTRVDIRGVIEQRAGYHDLCGGWTDGHDAIAERMIAAMADGDVLLVVDSPGGACAGLQEAVRAVLKTKAETGRRVTAFADEMIGSAAAWWVLSVADELWIPSAGVVGSIGARSSHCSIAGALEKEGVQYTHFAAPGPGKVALAPDQPLTETGRARAERDVWTAYLAFEAAVCGGPIGQRYGLTPEKLRALDADALTGSAAVDAGLADGVASLDEVVTYALALASGGETEMPNAASEYEKKTTTEERYSEDDPPADGEDMPKDEDAEEEEDGGAEGEGEDPEKEAEDDEPPPSSRKPPAESSAARFAPPKRMSQSASLAHILGAASESPIAIKTAALRMRQLRDHGAKLTGQRTIDGIMGGLQSIAEDAEQAGSLRKELTAQRRRNDRRERMDLLNKLAALGLPGYSRGDLFVDDVADDGTRRGVKPSRQYAEMRLDTLRGLVAGKTKGGETRKRSTPFEPDRAAAETAAKTAGVNLKTLEQHPAVKAAASRAGALPIAELAANYAATFPAEAAAFCAQNGA